MLGFHLAFCIGHRVKGQSFHEVVVAAEDGKRHCFFSAFGGFAELFECEYVVVLFEAGFAGNEVDLNIILCFRVRHCGGDDFEHLGIVGFLFHGTFGVFHHALLSCGCKPEKGTYA